LSQAVHSSVETCPLDCCVVLSLGLFFTVGLLTATQTLVPIDSMNTAEWQKVVAEDSECGKFTSAPENMEFGILHSPSNYLLHYFWLSTLFHIYNFVGYANCLYKGISRYTM